MLIRIWLARSPQRYPKIPNLGMRKNTLPMRRQMPQVLIEKETVVFPRPFNILISVVFAYIKGQIQARIIMKLPTA